GRQLDLHSCAEANDWHNIGGIIDLSLSLQSSPTSTQARGNFQILGFAWGSHHEKNPISARLNYKNHELNIASQGDALYLEAGLEGPQIALRRFHLIASQNLWIKGSGFVRGPEKELALKIEAQGLPVTDWPPLSKRYPEATG